MKTKFKQIKDFAVLYADTHWVVIFALALFATVISVLFFVWSISPSLEPSHPTQEVAEQNFINLSDFQQHLNRMDTEVDEQETNHQDEASKSLKELKGILDQLDSQKAAITPSPVSDLSIDQKLEAPLKCIQDKIGDEWSKLVNSYIPIHVKVIDFQTEKVDKLSLYKGFGRSGQLVKEWSGQAAGENVRVTEASGLTLTFQSDMSVVDSGWELLIYPEGMDITTAEPYNINDHLRDDSGNIQIREFSNAVRIFDSGGPKRGYLNKENIDFPIRFKTPNSLTNKVFIEQFLPPELDRQVELLNSVCQLAKSTSVKYSSYITNLILSLKDVSSSQSSKLIIDEFTLVAHETESLDHADFAQLAMGIYLSRLANKLKSSNWDMEKIKLARLLFRPYLKKELLTSESEFDSFLAIESSLLLGTMDQFIEMIAQLKIPSPKISKLNVFTELLAQNIKRSEQAQSLLEMKFTREMSDYYESMESYERSKQSKSSMRIPSLTSILSGLFFMGLIALAIILISIERAVTKLANINGSFTSSQQSTSSQEVSVIDQYESNSDDDDQVTDSIHIKEDLSHNKSESPQEVKQSNTPLNLAQEDVAVNWRSLTQAAFIQDQQNTHIVALKVNSFGDIQLLSKGGSKSVKVISEDMPDLSLLNEVVPFKKNEYMIGIYNPQCSLLAIAYGHHDMTKGTIFQHEQNQRHTITLSKSSEPGWLIYRVQARATV